MIVKNKVLIKLFVPELDSTFDVFIPVNELMWKIKKLIIKSVSDLSFGALEKDKNYVLINKINGKVYNNNSIVIETDIRNSSELILLSVDE